MADDNLFPDGTPETQPTAGAPDTTAVDELSAKLDALIDQQAQAPDQQSQVVEAITGLHQEIQALKAAQAPEDPSPVDPDDRFRKLYEDPDSYIEEKALGAVQGRLGPYLRVQAEQARDTLLAEQKGQIEAQFGEGAWDSDFAADMEETLGRMPLEMQSSKEHVSAAVAAIYGRKHLQEDTRKALEEKRNAASKVREERDSPPAMLDGSRPRPRGDTITQSEQDFIASLNRSGITYTVDQYLKAREKGSSESNWTKEAS